MNKVAKIISYVFHPILMPMVGIFIILNADTYIATLIPLVKNHIYIFVAIFTLLMPLGFSVLLLLTKTISSLQMENVNERQIPYLMTALFYYFNFYLLRSFNLPQTINLYFLGLALSITAAVVINLKWKISTHMIGIGGIVGLLIAMSLKFNVEMRIWIMTAFIVAGIIGSARLKLNSHTPAQVYVGFVVGVISILSVMGIYI